MTVRLDTFRQVAQANRPKDANLVAAQTAGAMVEMGCFAQEFTVYGTAFYEEGKRRYMVSSDEAKIADFVQSAAHAGVFPTPLSQLTMSVVVPAGCAEEVGRAVKKRLARELAELYPLGYFQLAAALMDTAPNDRAESDLWALRQSLEGVFDEEQLQLFEGLLDLAYHKKNVTELTYRELRRWLERTRGEMADDSRQKDRFSKTFYGFVYFKPDGSRAQDINVCREVIYQHRQAWQHQQVIMTPVFSKTYWYGYDCTVQELRAQFAAHLAAVFDERYLSLWQRLRAMPSAISREAFGRARDQARAVYGRPAQQALEAIGWRLGLLN